MSNVIILGDVHLGKGTNIGKSGIGTALNSRIVDQINLLDWTLDQAIEHDSTNIIVTGDIFEDPKPHPTLVCNLIEWVQKCAANEVHVHIIMGNHDILRTGTFVVSPLDILNYCEMDFFHLYKDVDTLTIDSVAFTLMPFRDRKSFICDVNSDALNLLKDSLNYELASIPVTYTKVLVGHFAIEGSIPVGDEIDDIANELFCPVDMFTGYEYVWMGHIHKPQVMNKKKPYVAHIGSMDISNFGESDQKKSIIVFDTEDLYWKDINLPIRPLTKINLVIPKDTKDSTQFVLDEIEKIKTTMERSIVRLEISLSSPELASVDRKKIEKAIYEKGAFNISGFSESKKMALVKKDGAQVIDTTIDVNSAVKMWADTKYAEKADESRKKRFTEIAAQLILQIKNESKE